jgi:dTDP-4-amino-4,6-dideoxygalactose transaminase
MNDLAASVGLGNLEEFPRNLARRRQIAAIYRRELAGVPGVNLLDYRTDRESAYWLFTMIVSERERFIRRLSANGVPSSVVHLRIDTNSVFGGITPDLENMEAFNRQQVSIPMHGSLTDDDVSLVIKTVRSGW